MSKFTIDSFKKSCQDNKYICYQVIQPNFKLLVELFGSYLTYNTLIKYNSINIESIQIAILVDLENYVNIYLWINNEYVNEEIRFKNIGSELIYKIEQLVYVNLINIINSDDLLNNNKLYISYGRFGLDFFDNYIRSKLSKNDMSIINKFISNLDPEDRYFEYYSISMKGREEYLYNELLLLDINDSSNKLFPVYLEDINTSSSYALERCYTDYDDDEYNSETDFITINKLEQIIIKNSHYQNIINNIINN